MLRDETTVIGVPLGDTKTVTKEHITDESQALFSYNQTISTVKTLAVDECAKMLLAGEEGFNGSGRVVQYRLDSGEVVSHYNRLGIGCVLSSARLGNLYFFGGNGTSSFTVVDALTRKVVHGPVKTAVKNICSLTAWTGKSGSPDVRAGLLAAGGKIDYSDDRADMFDVTELLVRHGDRDFLREIVRSQRRREQQLRSRVDTLEQRLQKMGQDVDAQAKQIEKKNKYICRLQNDKQDLQRTIDSLQQKARRAEFKRMHIRQQLHNLKVQNDWLAKQSVILAMSTGQVAETVPVSALSAGTVEVEKLRAQLDKAKKRNQLLTARNQKLQEENFDLQAEVHTLTRRGHKLSQTDPTAQCQQW